MSSTYHLLLMATFCFFCLLCHLKFQVRMAAQWTAWTRCMTHALGAPPKPQISKTILDCPSDALLVQVISNIKLTIVITCIAMGVSVTKPNGLVQLLSHLLWVMGPLLGPLSSVRYVVPVCIASCHARIIYILSIYVGMSRVCIHLGKHDHPVANDTCSESLDMAYQCVANEVLKTPTAKSSAIVMAARKQFLTDHLLKSPASGESHHLAIMLFFNMDPN